MIYYVSREREATTQMSVVALVWAAKAHILCPLSPTTAAAKKRTAIMPRFKLAVVRNKLEHSELTVSANPKVAQRPLVIF